MAFQLSPGVNVTEIDLTTVVPAVSTSVGAIAGIFRWGPVGERILVDSESTLLKRFGKPTNFNSETWFTASNFLTYGNSLYVSRAANTIGVVPTPADSWSVLASSTVGNNVLVYANAEIDVRTLGFEAGMYVTQSSNNTMVKTNKTYTINSVNSTSITVSTTIYNYDAPAGAPVNLPINPSIDIDFFNERFAFENHSFMDGDKVRYTVAAGNTAIAPLVSGTDYYIVDVIMSEDPTPIPLSFRLSETIGGSPVDLSDVGVQNESGHYFSFAAGFDLTLYFATPGTTYSAVALSSGGIVSNLVNQIVRNENDYILKDGTFDSEVLYVAKYPGSIGNSLRVSVCDTSSAYENSVMALTDMTKDFNANTESEDFNPYRNLVTRIGNTYAIVQGFNNNANASNFASNFALGDKILAGNSQIGYQYLQVTDVITSTGTNTNPISMSNAAIAITSNASGSSINYETGFISAPNEFYTNLMIEYHKDEDNDVFPGLDDGGKYYVTFANSSGFKISETLGGDIVSISAAQGCNSHVYSATEGMVAFKLQDPYNLHVPYTTSDVTRKWEFFGAVDSAPGQSSYVFNHGNTAAQDELHIVVVDEGGKFSGIPGSILEVYKGLSRATDSKNNDNTGNYYKDVINQGSSYIWVANDLIAAPSGNAAFVTSSEATSVGDYYFKFGTDGYDESNDLAYSSIVAAYDLFKSAEDVDISLVLQGRPLGGTTVVGGITVSGFQVANYIIDNIVEVRKDCVVFISADKSLTINSFGDETDKLKAWRGALRSTSYGELDSSYKYQYDRYNDVYRWVPLNGDIAGLCARTDQTNDAWWSPAGLNRGQIKNVVRLSYNPNKSQRDVLYSNGINPVVTFQGQGTVLYGDKTLQAKPSAFDRINVRRLFIVLEKAIATAAKYSMFEFNDAFTRAQFKNLIQPYLRNIQGRRGITDFKVVCDETNNTPQVIDSNQFVGDIYIKPARSINFIQLNFVAVATGVQFSEVVGKF
jgi:phage tail sheath protein FI